MADNVANGALDCDSSEIKDKVVFFLTVVFGLLVTISAGLIFLSHPVVSLGFALIGFSVMGYAVRRMFKLGYFFTVGTVVIIVFNIVLGSLFGFYGMVHMGHDSPDPETVFGNKYKVVDTVSYSDTLCAVDGGEKGNYVSYAVKNKEGVFVGVVEKQGQNDFFNTWNNVELAKMCKVIYH